MKVPYIKYDATGNTFILVDNRKSQYRQLTEKKDREKIAAICQQTEGLRVDGLILLNDSLTCHCKMTYFNADGQEAPMCGNGARASAYYLYSHEGIKKVSVETARAVYQVYNGKKRDRFHPNGGYFGRKRTGYLPLFSKGKSLFMWRWGSPTASFLSKILRTGFSLKTPRKFQKMPFLSRVQMSIL